MHALKQYRHALKHVLFSNMSLYEKSLKKLFSEYIVTHVYAHRYLIVSIIVKMDTLTIHPEIVLAIEN